MSVQFAAAAAVVIVCSACGSTSSPSPAPDSASTQPPASTSGNAAVKGRIARSLASSSAVIVLEPTAGTELPVNQHPAIMDQAGYEFFPASLIAQAGQPVEFRNSEDILHNVRVTETSTHEPVFNVATLSFGKYEHKFEPGFYDVRCDIHSAMHASIMVTDSPYTANTAEDGSFSISDVRPGKYNLTIYAGAAPVVRAVEVTSSGTDLGVIQ
jgi:plastocyanin